MQTSAPAGDHPFFDLGSGLVNVLGGAVSKGADGTNYLAIQVGLHWPSIVGYAVAGAVLLVLLFKGKEIIFLGVLLLAAVAIMNSAGWLP